MDEVETEMKLKVEKIEKLPHLPFLKRKINAILSDNN
jgi:hypothetical protein